MPATRIVLVSIPQVWVAYTYREFHAAMFASLGALSGPSQFELLADAMIVVALGLLTLAANCLVAAVLLKKAAEVDGRSYSAWSNTGLRAADAGPKRTVGTNPSRAGSPGGSRRDRPTARRAGGVQGPSRSGPVVGPASAGRSARARAVARED